MRAIARRLYEAVRALPIVSPHGHVDPRLLLDDEPFPDPATLLVTPDHYVTRLLHAGGVALDALGVGQGGLDEATAREVWRQLCTHWELYRGTPVRYWLESELADIFEVSVRPSAQTADVIYDQIADRLADRGLPAPRAVRAVRHRGACHHGRSVRRPGRAQRAGRGPRLEGQGGSDVPARRLSRAGAAGMGGAGTTSR